MYIYIGIFTLLSVLCLCEYFTKKKIFMGIGIITLFLVSGFRYKTGYDFSSYSDFFNRINSFQDVFNGTIDAEPGYLLINYIVKQLGMNFSVVVLVISLLSMIILGYCLNQYFPYPSFVLLYYYSRFFLVRDMGQIRSSIVSILFLYSLTAFKEKNFKKVLLISLIGSLFHMVSLFIIPAYLFVILFKKMTISKALVLIGISILVGVVFYFPDLYLFLIPERYQGYLSGYYAQGKWLLNPVFIMQMGILVASLLFVNSKNVRFEKSFNILLSLYCLSTICLVVFGPLATIGGRISTIFSTVEIFIVPIMLNSLLKNKFLYLLSFVGFSFVVFILIFIISGAYHSYIPYTSVFNL